MVNAFLQKLENGTVFGYGILSPNRGNGRSRNGRVRYETVRYGTVRVTNSDALLYKNQKKRRIPKKVELALAYVHSPFRKGEAPLIKDE